MSLRAPLALGLMLLLAGRAAAAPPLVLYTPLADAQRDTTSTAAGKPGDLTAAAAAQPPAKDCGTLQNPCQGLDPQDLIAVPPRIPSGVTYGMSGVVTAGVSNHGMGGGIGVTGWVKKDDFTLELSLFTSAEKWRHNSAWGPAFR